MDLYSSKIIFLKTKPKTGTSFSQRQPAHVSRLSTRQLTCSRGTHPTAGEGGKKKKEGKNENLKPESKGKEKKRPLCEEEPSLLPNSSSSSSSSSKPLLDLDVDSMNRGFSGAGRCLPQNPPKLSETLENPKQSPRGNKSPGRTRSSGHEERIRGAPTWRPREIRGCRCHGRRLTTATALRRTGKPEQRPKRLPFLLEILFQKKKKIKKINSHALTSASKAEVGILRHSSFFFEIFIS